MKTDHKPAREPADDWGPPLLLMPILVLIASISLAALVHMVSEEPLELLESPPPEATALAQPSR